MYLEVPINTAAGSILRFWNRWERAVVRRTKASSHTALLWTATARRCPVCWQCHRRGKKRLPNTARKFLDSGSPPEDYTDDIRISEEILKRLMEAYRRIRNTSRFILGNLYDFDVDSEMAGLHPNGRNG